MTEVAKPITRLLAPTPQIHQNLQILRLQDLRRPCLVHPLRLPIHQQPQHLAPIRRHETHRRPLRHHRPLRHPRRVAHRAQDTAPVRIPPVQRRLDERGLGDRRGDLPRVGIRGRVRDAHVHELGGALAVADDEFREIGGEGGEGMLHDATVGAGRVGDGRAAGGAVGQHGDGVVGAGVAVDGDAVEAAVGGVREEGVQGGRGDGRVGAEDAEEGGHVGVDHAGAFGHAGEGVGC